MIAPSTILATYILLSFAICAAYGHRYASLGYRFPVVPLFILAVAAGFGVTSGVLAWPAIVAGTVYYGIVHFAARGAKSKVMANIAWFGAVIVALALSIHVIPGFHNLLLLQNWQFSAGSAPFTQYANFDKALAGLVLLLFFGTTANSTSDLKQAFSYAVPRILVLVAAIFIIALGLGFVRIDIKLPAYALVFLPVNLLFTCVAEEVFFRGLIQDKLLDSFYKSRGRESIAIAISALLFGIVHYAGGPLFIGLSTLAGFGYAYLYSKTKRIEVPLLAHFVLDTFHFFLFTYPRAA